MRFIEIVAPRKMVSSALTCSPRPDTKKPRKSDIDIERARDRTMKSQRHLDRIKADDELEREAMRIISGK